jgi:FeS assembly SUF system protein
MDQPTTEKLTVDVLRQRIVDTLSTIFDPEIPVNIYELGLIYDLDVQEDGKVDIKMTLTSPMCPVAGSLPPEVETKVRATPGVADVNLQIVWDPPWSMERMSEAAKLQLGFF